jgi:predicted negative regulator of RcsB-dependent stress response
MAFEVLDEHEQGELVQKWLRENAVAILVGIGLGLLLIFGWQQWKVHGVQHRLEASVQYQALTEHMEKKDLDAVGKLGATLRADYADTPYALLGALRQADAALAKGDKDAALADLKWAYDNAGASALAPVAGARLARLQIGMGKALDALAVLDKLPKDSFVGLLSELRGDALAALGRKDEARNAYTETLTNIDPNAPNRAFVEMKLNDLGGGMEKQG